MMCMVSRFDTVRTYSVIDRLESRQNSIIANTRYRACFVVAVLGKDAE